MSTEKGILLIDKPKGITSFDVVKEVKKQTGEKKVGHAGTLDPLATGLMVIGVGEGTKKLTEYIGANKTYTAEVCIGERSTTGDAEGEITEKSTVENIAKDKVEDILTGMKGILRLEVSIYSAMKKGGEEFYKKARRGERVTPPQRDMEVIQTKLESEIRYKNDCAYCDIEFEVGSGTYIRSLAEELGRRLGYPARLENLRRTQVGEMNITDADTI